MPSQYWRIQATCSNEVSETSSPAKRLDGSSCLTGKDDVALAHMKGQFIGFVRTNAYVRLNDIAKVTGKRLDNWMMTLPNLRRS
jgi:hypothetical protein